MPALTTRPILMLTDYGVSDEYVGVLKCVILSINRRVQLVDITHQIPPYDIYTGMFIISKSMKYFPPDSILLAIVDPGVGGERKAIVGVTDIGKKIFFVGPDNGIFTPLLENSEVYEIDTDSVLRKARKYVSIEKLSLTFHGRDLFAPAAALISKGEKIKNISKGRIQNPRRIDFPEPKVDKSNNLICGNVIHIDRFGNIITDVEVELLGNWPACKIDWVLVGGYKIQAPLVSSYDSVNPGEFLLIIGSYDTLEISMREGNAANKLGVKRFDKVEIKLR